MRPDVDCFVCPMEHTVTKERMDNEDEMEWNTFEYTMKLASSVVDNDGEHAHLSKVIYPMNSYVAVELNDGVYNEWRKYSEHIDPSTNESYGTVRLDKF